MKLAIIHTTALTVEPLQRLAGEVLPGTEVINFVDDAVLPQLAENGGDVGALAHRLIQYARFAEECGAQAILEACSSVGEAVGPMREAVAIPVVRIDEAMADEAVHRGPRIGVAATVATTLQPTLALLRETAGGAGREVALEPLLVEAAYRRLHAGDREGHDALLADALAGLATEVDVVVLAQASMARVLPRLPDEAQRKFLTSPPLAMERVKNVLEGAKGR